MQRQTFSIGHAAVLLASAVLFLSSHSGARAQSVNLGASADNTLYQTSTGSTSNGAGSSMFAGWNGQSSTRRAVILFDLASVIPSGSTITSATLTLHQSSANTGPHDVTLHRLLESWGEGASVAGGNGGNGGASAAGDATWIHRSFSSSLWSTPGGTFDPAVVASTSVAGNGFYSWSSVDLTAQVQAMLDAPALNFGWLIRGGEGVPSSAKSFATRENPDESLRPVLRVDYVVPQPGVVSLAGAMSLLAVARRRR